MPFTFSHPAAVLPLKRFSGGRLLMAGLLAGSVAPDFEYFLRFKSSVSHTFKGLFIFNLPVGILITLIFFLIIKDSLLPNLPAMLRERLIRAASFDWLASFRKHWPMLIISILIGAFTHILWDSFTHRTGFSVQTFNSLENSITILGYHIPFYRILQHLSTLIGGIICLIYIWKMPRIKMPGKVSILYWLIYTCIVIVCLFVFKKLIRPDNMWYLALTVVISLLLPLIPTGIFWRLYK